MVCLGSWVLFGGWLVVALVVWVFEFVWVPMGLDCAGRLIKYKV